MSFSIGCAQLACQTLDLEYNLQLAESLLEEAVQTGCELVLLPEYTPTGLLFDGRIKEHAEPLTGRTVSNLRDWSKKHDCWIGAGVAEKCCGRFFNTFVLSGPSGEFHFYRKRYLAFFEKLVFSRGKEIGIIDTPFGRVGMMICWDMIHDKLAREMAGNIDLLLIASAWPDVRTGNIPLHGIKNWLSNPPYQRPEELARRLGVPVAYCNLGGEFTTKVPGLGLTYQSELAGQSCIIDLENELHERAGSLESSLVVAELGITSTRANKAVA